MKNYFLLLIVCSYSVVVFSQELNVEGGAFIEWKDEFFIKPSSELKYIEFYSFSINGQVRVFKNKFGVESTLGFEKSFLGYKKDLNNEMITAYQSLDRLTLAILPYVYLMKKEKSAIDLALGFKYYANLNNQIDGVFKSNVDLSKVSVKTAINYNIKKFQVGLFGEYDLVSDFDALVTPFSFGARFGYLGF